MDLKRYEEMLVAECDECGAIIDDEDTSEEARALYNVIWSALYHELKRVREILAR